MHDIGCNMVMLWFPNHFAMEFYKRTISYDHERDLHNVLNGTRVRILARILAKCELKKQLARWYFLYLHFLASGNLLLLSVVLILDINLLSSFFKDICY